jgi:tetratricopeptide (TPR) repeat protein
MSDSSSINPNTPNFLDEYPSSTERETLTKQIEEIKGALASPPENFPRNKAMIKLADLYVGRNEEADYIEAGKLYDEVLSSSLPREVEHAQALIGNAELAHHSNDPGEVSSAIESTKKALRCLEENQRSFFFGKGKVLLAELLLKRGTDEDRQSALDMYEELTANTAAHKYFKMRAVVGKVELMNYFFKDILEAKAEQSIDECEEALDFLKDERRNDYFYLKGMIVLAEVLLWRDKESFKKKASKLLNDVVNSQSAGDDLRARASLDLAEISSPALAKSLIKGVRHMDGVDPYLLKKAKAIEDALPHV